MLLVDLNQRPFKKLPGCRRSAFESLDTPALRPLPAERYAIGRWKTAKVNIDYHVEFEGHYYSVPHRLVGAKIDVRVTGGLQRLRQPQAELARAPAAPGRDAGGAGRLPADQPAGRG